MSATPMHEVKTAAAVLADDVICQSFIQSSSTLAYACLLIRDRKYDLAVHVLHSLEAKQASRFKDMVFYLQAQIGIETGEFTMVKKRLVPRVNQQPNDMVALSLLECCIFLEFTEWERSHPQAETLSAESGTHEVMSVRAGSDGSGSGFSLPSFANPEAAIDNADSGRAEANHGVPMADSGHAEATFGNHQAASAAAYAASFNDPVDPPYSAAPQQPRQVQPFHPASEPSIRPAQSAPAAASNNIDFGMFQALANDQNTQAMAIWSPEKGKFKSTCRIPELESLVALMLQEFPGSIQAGCTPLDCGTVHKICFSFQSMTVTSFHSGSENLGIVTGNINQSLLTIVRAENTFRKQSASIAQTASMAASAPPGRAVGLAPNE